MTRQALQQAHAARTVPVFPAPGGKGDGGGSSEGPAPEFTYRGGPLLSSVEIFTAFWGRRWHTAAHEKEIAALNAFLGRISGPPLAELLQRFWVPGRPIGAGRLVGTSTVVDSLPENPVDDQSVRQMLRDYVAGSLRFVTPTPNTLYFVFLPPEVNATLGTKRSCHDFCGYHDDIGGRIYYAVVPYPDCKLCCGRLDAFESLTVITSHLLWEAVTDPAPGTGWYDDAHGEICDPVAWETVEVEGYVVQRVG